MAARALLLDLDRTLVDLQSFTDYAAALSDVEALLGRWSGADVPETDWDQPTMACMSVLHSLLGDPRWRQVSDAIAVHELAAVDQSTLMPTVPRCGRAPRNRYPCFRCRVRRGGTPRRVARAANGSGL